LEETVDQKEPGGSTIPPIDPNYTLQPDQQIWFDLATGGDKAERTMIVVGSAGTGKSFTAIRIMHQLGPETVARAAMTASAARLIYGQTVHSTFKIPVESNASNFEFKPLQKDALKELQDKFRKIETVIIDELSLMSGRMLGKINLRCQQAKANPNQAFGGLAMILVGDFGQYLFFNLPRLPPVLEKPMFSEEDSKNDFLEKRGREIYRSIKNVICLEPGKGGRIQKNEFLESGERNTHQDQFVELIDKLHDGQMSKDHWQILMGNVVEKISDLNTNKDWKNAIRIFP
jgi:hypothetical protein